MNKEQAQQHPEAQAFLARYAEDKLFELQIKNSPSTVMFATAIRRWLDAINPTTGDEKIDRERRASAKARGLADPEIAFRGKKARAERLIKELIRSRRLGKWNENLVDEVETWLVKAALIKGKTENKNGQFDGARDVTIDGYFGVVRQMRDWLNPTYKPPINLPLKSFNPKSLRSEPLLWREARLIILYALGYVWKNGGFAQHWVLRNGEWRLEFEKLAEPLLTKHRAEYFPLLRVVPKLFTTGTRPAVSINSGWQEQPHRGWVELAGVLSVLHRRGTEGPSYTSKPRLDSPLLPLARGFLQVCRAKDLCNAVRDGWPGDRAQDYVIHNGRGGAAPNTKALFVKACKALGIKNSIKKLKHAFVTTMWLSGFDLDRIAILAGTDPKTTRDFYRFLETQYSALVRPRPDAEKMTWADLVDPYGTLQPIPRAPAPPRPDVRTAAASEAPLHA